MPVARSKKLAIVERRKKVADLYIHGWTQTEIGAHMGYTQATICADLQWIRKEWRESMVRDFDLAREIELKKLDRIEREAWAAWERSQQPAQSAHINDETNRRKTRRHIRNQYGEPRFLEQVNKCIACRSALLGLGTVRTEEGADGYSFDERRDRIVAVVAALRDRAGAARTGTGPGDREPRLLRADCVERTVAAGPTPGLP
jgi:hypothetical protein